MEKVEVQRTLDIDIYSLDDKTLQEVVDYLLSFKDKVPTHAKIDLRCYDGWISSDLVWKELESDIELAYRIRIHNEALARERKQYERLKAKFEGE